MLMGHGSLIPSRAHEELPLRWTSLEACYLSQISFQSSGCLRGGDFTGQYRMYRIRVEFRDFLIGRTGNGGRPSYNSAGSGFVEKPMRVQQSRKIEVLGNCRGSIFIV